SDVLEARTHEALRANSSSARTRATQLVQSPRTLRARRNRGVQQQGSNYDTKSLRLSNLRARRNRPVSCTRRPTRARLDHPQIFLRRPRMKPIAGWFLLTFVLDVFSRKLMT